MAARHVGAERSDLRQGANSGTSAHTPAASAAWMPRGSDRIALLLLYAAFAICVAATCFTNDVILELVRRHAGLAANWPAEAARRLPYATADRYDQYLLGSVKDAGFFLSLLIFAFLLRGAVAAIWPAIRSRRLWLDLLIGLAIASIFLFEIVPAGMGRIYAYNSVEPFLQHQGFFHRRILMPVLAHYAHLDGVLYAAFYWILALFTLALASIYLEQRGLRLSRLELASLYTTGIFATAIALPGHGEILVFALTLLAMLDAGRRDGCSIVQPACFALALLAHETAAVLAFGALALTSLDRRFLLHFAAILAVYATIWLASYGFDLGRAVSTQLTGGTSNFDRFRNHLPLAMLGMFAAYKLTLIAAVPAVARFAGTGRLRLASLVCLALGGGLALMAIATDYTRMAAFGGFAMLFVLPEVLMPLSLRTRRMLASANLAIPTVYVSAQHGAVAYHGLYGLVLTGWFGMQG